MSVDLSEYIIFNDRESDWIMEANILIDPRTNIIDICLNHPLLIIEDRFNPAISKQLLRIKVLFQEFLIKDNIINYHAS